MCTDEEINAKGNNTRICKFCTKELSGRPDKQFCHYNCRNGYNNKKNRQSITPKILSLIPSKTNLNICLHPLLLLK